jgi:hypothetical protein
MLGVFVILPYGRASIEGKEEKKGGGGRGAELRESNIESGCNIVLQQWQGPGGEAVEQLKTGPL